MIHGALAFQGKCPSLGAIRASSVEIRAFGPEKAPLGEENFGIRPILFHRSRWASPRFDPEVWFSSQLSLQEESGQLDLTFYGLCEERPLFFSFYVAAGVARVGERDLEAGGLKRYSGPVASVQFNEVFCLQGEGLSHLEVIPVAGMEFWHSQYLVAFRLRSSQVRFSFRLLA